MILDDKAKALLTEEISELRENLCCNVYVYSKVENALIGQAILELWVMIEDSCNILRQVQLTIISSPRESLFTLQPLFHLICRKPIFMLAICLQ
jgi:hypothetical protein